MQLTSSLSLSEMLAVMQGNLGAITGLNQKLRTILLKKLGNEDSAQRRQQVAMEEAAKFKALLKIPEAIRPHIYEGFEPLLVSEEVVDSHFSRVLDIILDFDQAQTDAAFIEEMKDALAHFIGEWIEELQDGFHNGMSDVVVFFRENFKEMLMLAAGPEMGMMVGMMGTDFIMNQVNSANNRYRERKAAIIAASKEREQRKKQGLSQAAAEHTRPAAEDTKMEEVEEQKASSPEDMKKRFWEKWR